MKTLIILGAGRFGREVLGWARQTHSFGVDWRIGGFLDSRANILDGYGVAESIIGSPETYHPADDNVFICALGEVVAKKRYCAMLTARGAEFVNVIHSTVVIGDNVKLGRGVVLCPNVVVSSNVTVGDFVTVNINSFLAHDVRVADYCQVHGNASVNGGVLLGHGCTVGSNATILPDVSIGDFAVVGAGSVVLQAVQAGQTVFGNPAKPLGLPPRVPSAGASVPSDKL